MLSDRKAETDRSRPGLGGGSNSTTLESMTKRNSILCAAVISFSTASCMSNEASRSAPLPTSKKSSGSLFEEIDRKQLSARSFPEVALLCGALSAESLPTRTWKNLYSAVPDMAPQYACMSSMLEIGSDGPMGLPTNITYFVYGVKVEEANEVKLVVNVNNPSTKQAAKTKLLQVAKVLFRKCEWKFPSELEKAIGDYRQTQIPVPFGSAAFEIDKGKIDTFSVVVKAKK